MKFSDSLWQLSTISLLTLTTTRLALAQITPDGTLSNNSLITPQGLTIQIEGGTQSGGNLFHSFQEFSVPTGSTAFFNNALDVQNILTRVTGSNISHIDGLLKANGRANLFLLNPNGIIFGPNAALNIGGSFLASTAHSLRFADGAEFRTTATQPTPLLTISVPVGLQLGDTSGTIINQSRATVPGLAQPVGLAVLPGQTLVLAGGNIQLPGGILTAPGGRIELAAIQNGSIATANNQPLLSSSFSLDPSSLQGEIQLSGAGAVNASGIGGGNVQLIGDRITLTEGSRIAADTLGDANGAGITLQSRQLTLQDGAFISASTFGSGSGGNLAFKVSEAIEIAGTGAAPLLEQFLAGNLNLLDLNSGIYAISASTGATGNIAIATGKLAVSNGAAIATSTLIAGKGGDLTINASDSINMIRSNILTGTAGTGDSGNLAIATGQLTIGDGALITSGTTSTGIGGHLTVRAAMGIELIGNPTNAQFGGVILPSGLISSTGSSGNAGDLTIDTPRLIVRNGAAATTETLGAGRGGNLTIHADTVEVSGTSADNQSVSSLLSRTRSTGSAGNLTLTTRTLVLQDQGLISTETRSTGTGGNLTIDASDSIELIGSPIPSDNINRIVGIFADSFPTEGINSDEFVPDAPAGPAGNIILTTPRLVVRDGAEIGAGAFGRGQGGSITINATDFIEASGVSPDELRFPTNIYVDSVGAGDAGTLTINTGRLIVRDGAQISSGSFGQGMGGSVIVNASQSVELSGSAPSTPEGEEIFFGVNGRFPSGLITNSLDAGTAGEVKVNTGSLTVRDGAVVAVSNIGTGNAGNVTVNADAIALANQGGIIGITRAGQGGNIELNARSIVVHNSPINASVLGEGTGGSINIRASESVEVIGGGLLSLQQFVAQVLLGMVNLADLQTGIVTGTEGTGNAGDITISTGKLTIRDGGLVLVPTLGQGRAGNLFVNAAQSVEVNGSFLAAATAGTGTGGSVEINTRQLVVRNQGQVSSTTLAAGDAGDVSIHASDFVDLIGSPIETVQTNGLSASAFFGSSGAGGDLRIRTPQLSVRNGSEISVGSLGSGNAGDMILEVGSLTLDQGDISATSPVGRGGNIRLQVSNSLRLHNQSQISTRAGSPETGGGDGGNITIDAATITALENSSVNANAFAGAGGNIRITTQGIFLSSDSTITASSQLGVDGVVEVTRPDVDPSSGLVQLPETVTDTTNQIATSCAHHGRNEFIVTGRSGLPEDPSQTLRGRTVWRDVRPVVRGRDGAPLPTQSAERRRMLANPQSPSLIEAQGWAINAKGQVELVAPTSHLTPSISGGLTKCGGNG